MNIFCSYIKFIYICRMNIQSSTMNKRELILKSALKLITEKGFHGTVMSEMAKEAGVAAGTIYHYFKTKEEIIAVLYSELKEQFGEAIRNQLTANKPVKARFFGVYSGIYHFFITHPMEFRFLEQYANSPYISNEIVDENKHFYQGAIDFLSDGINAGVLRQMDINLMVSLVYGSITTVAKLRVVNQIEVSDEMLQSAIQSCWDGVRIN